MIDPDQQFFLLHPDRQAHIRLPLQKVLVRNKQRAVFYRPECEQEFLSLGEHEESRRRIILWKVPKGDKHYGKVLKIPFLAFSDETIEDDDRVLLPIVEEIMQEAARA